MTHLQRLRRPAAFAATLAILALGACSSEDSSPPDPADASSTSAASQFGSSMGVTDGTAAEVAALGSGPKPGDTWTVPVGLNVCGRFLEPISATREADGTAITSTDRGEVELTVSEVGSAPTLGDYADVVGIDLEPGTLSFPDTARPEVLDSTQPETPIAGATLRDGDRCDGTEGTVQVWVYSAAARESGDGILVITEDTTSIPFAEHGMAVVIAFSPTSSLPTLPPSALSRG